MSERANEQNYDPDFDFSAARAAVLTWFRTNGRSFPWREDPTPYRVWISEIMLQQTTTQTALGYFERFLTRFPDPRSLAAASEEETLKYWQGLGYYRRAKALRAAAIEIVEKYAGAFPEEYEAVLSLPGVGRYAAGAILSFGFDRRFPILEANTTRLNARLLALREETTLASSQKILWRFAEDWLPEESKRHVKNVYRNINGALTDLGRLVCAPKDPLCERCPLANFCATKKLGLQSLVPVLKRKPEPIRRTDAAIWLSRGDLEYARKVRDAPECQRSRLERASDVLLIRRPQDALWSGLWDFPRFEVSDAFAEAQELAEDALLADRLQFFLEEEAGAPGKDYRVGRALTTIRHAVTKYRVALIVARLRGAELERSLFEPETSEASSQRAVSAQTQTRLETKPQAEKLLWVPLDALAEYPTTSPARRIAEWIAKRL